MTRYFREDIPGRPLWAGTRDVTDETYRLTAIDGKESGGRPLLQDFETATFRAVSETPDAVGTLNFCVVAYDNQIDPVSGRPGQYVLANKTIVLR